ncbi:MULTISPECIES: NAD-dependent epimerase/dehydratase family protein [unclassified Moraxella]|uniref:NAD-dependent epimerase/dehydratase family protein n=1 Tax=unclassified Moraxella TaxID=2685852 RepID=UPI003AF5E7E3
MKILIFGSNGFIGQRLVERLTEYELVLTSSRDVDFTKPNAINLDKITTLMQGVDVVINIVGIMSNDKTVTENVHHHSSVKIATIAKSQGVKKWVNLSALGADENSDIAFVGSKGRGDTAILALADDNFKVKIARPSLVFGVAENGKKGGASTELFLKLANLPILVLPNGGNFAIQPVHVNDVALGLVKFATENHNLPNVIDFTGEKVLTLADYLTELRMTILGKGKPKIVAMPMGLAKFFASILQNFSDMVSVDSLTLLEQGNTADNQRFLQLLK